MVSHKQIRFVLLWESWLFKMHLEFSVCVCVCTRGGVHVGVCAFSQCSATCGVNLMMGGGQRCFRFASKQSSLGFEMGIYTKLINKQYIVDSG